MDDGLPEGKYCCHWCGKRLGQRSSLNAKDTSADYWGVSPCRLASARRKSQVDSGHGSSAGRGSPASARLRSSRAAARHAIARSRPRSSSDAAWSCATSSFSTSAGSHGMRIGRPAVESADGNGCSNPMTNTPVSGSLLLFYTDSAYMARSFCRTTLAAAATTAG